MQAAGYLTGGRGRNGRVATEAELRRIGDLCYYSVVSEAHQHTGRQMPLASSLPSIWKFDGGGGWSLQLTTPEPQPNSTPNDVFGGLLSAHECSRFVGHSARRRAVVLRCLCWGTNQGAA